MKIFYFDIETVPTEKALEENGLLDAQIKLDEPELIKKLSLSALSAKIICLCYTIEPSLSGAVEVLQGEETDIIKNFWKIVPDCNLFVGHNILDFDMRFIYQRSVIHQIKPSRDIPFTRFRNAPIYDTMQEWSKWGREHASLDSLSKALGIPSPQRKSRRLQSVPLLPRRQTPRDRRILQTGRRIGAGGLQTTDVYEMISVASFATRNFLRESYFRRPSGIRPPKPPKSTAHVV